MFNYNAGGLLFLCHICIDYESKKLGNYYVHLSYQ